MANLYQGKVRRRLQRALRAVNRLLLRDHTAGLPKKTKAVTTRAQVIPAEDVTNFNRMQVVQSRLIACLNMQI